MSWPRLEAAKPEAGPFEAARSPGLTRGTHKARGEMGAAELRRPYVTRPVENSGKSSGSAQRQAEHKPSVPRQPMHDTLLGRVAAAEMSVTSSPPRRGICGRGVIYTPAVFGGGNGSFGNAD